MKIVYLFLKLDVFISIDEKIKLKGFFFFFIKKICIGVYENKYYSIRLYSLGLYFFFII